ncbi:hypothetical protein Hanom_Chr16g01457201 [Helianthus anomalus]
MGSKIWELVEMQVWLVMDGWGRMGMFVVVMVNSWWVFGKGIVMYGCVDWKLGGEGRFDRVVCWDYAKCGKLDVLCGAKKVNMGSWLLVEWLDEGWLLDYVLLIRSLLEIKEVEELKIQECFYVYFCAGTWMDAMLLVIFCLLIVLMYRALGFVFWFYIMMDWFMFSWMCRIVVCLGRSRILLIHFVRLAALGVVYSLGFMSRGSKPLYV